MVFCLQHQTLVRDHSSLRVDRVASSKHNDNAFNTTAHQQQEQLMLQVSLC